MPKYTPILEIDEWHGMRAVSSQLTELYAPPAYAEAMRPPEAEPTVRSIGSYALKDLLSRVTDKKSGQAITVEEFSRMVAEKTNTYPVESEKDIDKRFNDLVAGLEPDAEAAIAEDALTQSLRTKFEQASAAARAATDGAEYILVTDEAEPRYAINFIAHHEGYVVQGSMAMGMLEYMDRSYAPDIEICLEFSGESEGFWIRTAQGESWPAHELGLLVSEGIIMVDNGEEGVLLAEACQDELQAIVARASILPWSA